MQYNIRAKPKHSVVYLPERLNRFLREGQGLRFRDKENLFILLTRIPQGNWRVHGLSGPIKHVILDGRKLYT